MKPKLPRPINSLGVFRRLPGLVFVTSLVSTVMLGCGGALPAATPPLTPTPVAPTVEQLISKTSKAMNAAKTLKADTDMSIKINTIGGQKPVTMSMAINGTGVVNIANKEMQTNISMNTDMQELGTQKITMQMYMVGGYSYIKLVMPGAVDQWMKMKLTDQMWQSQVQVDQQVALLKTAGELRIVGTEDIGGVQTYVVVITPDMQAMLKLLGQTQGMEALDFGKFGADLYKDTTVRYWISRDNYLLTKIEVQTAGEIPSSALGDATADFDKMTMNLRMKANYTYDQPVSITLPEEAQGAKEISSPYSRD